MARKVEQINLRVFSENFPRGSQTHHGYGNLLVPIVQISFKACFLLYVMVYMVCVFL